jgi:hypothetical protein
MRKSFGHQDRVTGEHFRIYANDGMEAMVKFRWWNDQLDDDDVRNLNMGMDPDGWDRDNDIEEIII